MFKIEIRNSVEICLYSTIFLSSIFIVSVFTWETKLILTNLKIEQRGKRGAPLFSDVFQKERYYSKRGGTYSRGCLFKRVHLIKDLHYQVSNLGHMQEFSLKNLPNDSAYLISYIFKVNVCQVYHLSKLKYGTQFISVRVIITGLQVAFILCPDVSPESVKVIDTNNCY